MIVIFAITEDNIILQLDKIIYVIFNFSNGFSQVILYLDKGI